MLKVFKDFFRLFLLAEIIFLALLDISFSLEPRRANKWLVIEKASKTLTLYQEGKEIASFPCSFGLNPLIPKTKRGDLATPEGLYRVRFKVPSRKYYLFVGLDYPNLKDIQRAFWKGRLTKKEYQRYLKAYEEGRSLNGPLGNGIGIHGGGLYRKGKARWVRDWTHGCIALNNRDMEKVYRFVEPGTPVLIYNRKRPFFEILRELVVPDFWKEGWQGQLNLYLRPYNLSLEILLTGKRNGARAIEMVGIDELSGTPLFYIRDLNGNGALEPLDHFYFRMEGFPGGYPFLQRLVLEELPKEVLDLIPEKIPGWPLRERVAGFKKRRAGEDLTTQKIKKFHQKAGGGDGAGGPDARLPEDPPP